VTLPDGYAVRAATREDAEAITEVLVAQEIAVSGVRDSTVEDLYDDWSTPGFDFERDTWLVTRDGQVAAYGAIVKHIPPDAYAAYGAVHPDHWRRGLGAFLIAAVEWRVAEKADGPAAARQWVDANDEGAVALLQRRGYEFVRRFWRMDVALDDVVEPAPLDGITIRPFEKGRDERRAHGVLEDAFAEHWGFTPRTYEEAAAARWDAEWFQPEVSLVAEADGEIVAVCINSTPLGEGYVADIGVLKDWRRRGIAEALLRKSFVLFKDAGLERASLHVDSDNSTGATRLYERVGMHPGTRYDVYQVRVGASD